MNIFDLVTKEEIEGAPEDSAFAFTELVGIAEGRLTGHLRELDPLSSSDSEAMEEARYAFMNVAIALARIYKIEPFASREVPRVERFGLAVFRQFKADLDHYVMQLLVDNSLRSKRDSALIPPETKERIRSYIHALRDAIDKADLTESKRANLHRRLSDFESELEKRRLNLQAVALIVLAISTVPGDLWSSYDVVNNLTGKVLRLIGEAKEIEDEQRRLPPAPEPVALMAPRKDEAEPSRNGSFHQDLDDEIPF